MPAIDAVVKRASLRGCGRLLAPVRWGPNRLHWAYKACARFRCRRHGYGQKATLSPAGIVEWSDAIDPLTAQLGLQCVRSTRSTSFLCHLAAYAFCCSRRRGLLASILHEGVCTLPLHLLPVITL